MLLEHDLLALARVWRHRETIEHEAAEQFARLTRMLKKTGASTVVMDMAEEAGRDEIDHAERCRAIVDRLQPGLDPVAPPRDIHLGPRDLTPRRRTLYACVALSCVTETLSSALLLAMSETATDTLVADTVHHILKDEISHSRLGWAHLADESRREDVAWLAPYVGGMLRDALRSDIAPMTSEHAPKNAPAFGILTPSVVGNVTREAIEAVIVPGLSRFGIDVDLGLDAGATNT